MRLPTVVETVEVVVEGVLDYACINLRRKVRPRTVRDTRIRGSARAASQRVGAAIALFSLACSGTTKVALLGFFLDRMPLSDFPGPTPLPYSPMCTCQ